MKHIRKILCVLCMVFAALVVSGIAAPEAQAAFNKVTVTGNDPTDVVYDGSPYYRIRNFTITLEGGNDGTKSYNFLTEYNSASNSYTAEQHITYDGENFKFLIASKSLMGVSSDSSAYTLNITYYGATSTGPYGGYYQQRSVNCSLNVRPCPVTVWVSGNNATENYDGEVKTAEGYTYRASVDHYYGVKYRNSDAKPSVSGTAIGTYYMGLQASDFSQSNNNYDATFVIEQDGCLKIEPETVYITIDANDTSATYDGEQKMASGYTATCSAEWFDAAKVSYGSDDIPWIGGTDIGRHESDAYDLQGFSYDGEVPANYTIRFKGTDLKNTVEIAKCPVDVAIMALKSEIYYDGDEHILSGVEAICITSPAPAGWEPDKVSYDGTLPVAKGTNAGEYTAQLDASKFMYIDPNYDVTFVEQGSSLTTTLTIKKRPIEIRANGDSFTYGERTFTPSFDVIDVLTGETLQNDIGEGVNFTLPGGTGAAIASTVTEGDFVNVPGATYCGDLPANVDLSNYVVSYPSGRVEIEPLQVEVRANDAEMTYLDALPEFTAQVEGVIDNAVIDYTISTTATSSSSCGEYKIDVQGEQYQGNYDVAFYDGTLKIDQRDVVVTVSAEQVVTDYNGQTQQAGYTLDFSDPRFDGEDKIRVAYEGEPVRAKDVTELPLIYQIKKEDFTYRDPNWNITYEIDPDNDTISLEIIPYEISIESVGKTVDYIGNAHVPEYSVSFAGGSSMRITLDGGYTIPGTGETLSVSKQPTADLRNANTSDIDSTGVLIDFELNIENDSNYTVDKKYGELRISRSPLRMAVNHSSKVYGQDDPAGYAGYVLDVLYGPVGTDTQEDLGITIVRENAAENTDAAGYQGVLTAECANENYYLRSVIKGDFKIEKAPLRITSFGNVGDESRRLVYNGQPQSLRGVTVWGSAADAFNGNYTADEGEEFIFIPLYYGDVLVVDNFTQITDATGSASVPNAFQWSMAEDLRRNYSVQTETNSLVMEPAEVFVGSASDGELTYNGQPQTYPAYSVKIGDNEAVEYTAENDAIPLLTDTETLSVTGFAQITNVSESGMANTYTATLSNENNYRLVCAEPSVLKMNPKEVTITPDAVSKVYGDSDQSVTLSAAVTGLVAPDAPGMLEYGLVREEGENVGEYVIRSYVDDPANLVQGNYALVLNEGVFTIEPRPVTLNLYGGKCFGVTDPEKTEEDYAVIYTNVLPADLEGTTIAELFDFDISRISREEGESVGEYAIDFAEEDKVIGNYKVTYEGGIFSITAYEQPYWYVSLGEIGTHSDTVSFEILPADGCTLIPDFHKYVKMAVSVSGLPENVKLSEGGEYVISEGTTGTISIPLYDYTVKDANGNEYGWQSYLPKDAVVVLGVTPLDREGYETELYTGNSGPVRPVETVMTPSFNAGAGMKVYSENGGVYQLLDENGTIGLPRPEYVSDGDWIVVTVNGNSYVTTYGDFAALGLDELKAMAGEAEGWHGTDPLRSLNLEFTLLDTTNHIVTWSMHSVSFDTGAANSTQEIGNRPTEGTLVFTLKDSSGDDGTTADKFGGSTPELATEGKMAWTNVQDYVNYPTNLPHSGDTIVVTYSDKVGHSVKHTITVVRSDAVTGNTIYVKPMTGDTVPSGDLTFYGETNAYEELVLTVGGRSFTVKPVPSGESYGAKTAQWTYTVDLGEIDFPVGVPTEIGIAYEDLNGKGSVIELTYKDEAQTPAPDDEAQTPAPDDEAQTPAPGGEAQTPAPGGEALVGTSVVWGFVEPSARVRIEIEHADGTKSAVPAANIAVDQFGYYCARLEEALKEGDTVTIRTTDFCGNTKKISCRAVEELKENAFAELLGANISGVYDNGTTEVADHRFATPIDLAALAASEEKTLEVPILAYKGIEIGTVQIVLTEEGRLEVRYAISAPEYVPAEAQIRMSSYAQKPGIEELALGTHKTVVNAIGESYEGVLGTIDVASYYDKNGEISGVLWLYAEFDIEMDEASYVEHGSAANHYRWLAEGLQSESVLNAKYAESAAYEKNMLYYELYTRFETISGKL